MNDDDVFPYEMNEHYEFDDNDIEALLSGDGAEINEDLAGMVASVRAAYVSEPPAIGSELAVMIGDAWPAAATRTPRARGPRRLRRLVVATVAVFGLTSGLAVANALPGPVQNAIAKVGIGQPDNHGKTVSEVAHNKALKGCEHGRVVSAVASGKTKDKPCPHTSTTTTTTSAGEASENPTLAAGEENHGNAVSAVAHDKSLTGCEHGRAVSALASGKTNEKPCKQSSTTTTTTTVAGNTTTTIAEDGPNDTPGKSGEHGQDGSKPKEDGDNNGNGQPTGNGHTKQADS